MLLSIFYSLITESEEKIQNPSMSLVKDFTESLLTMLCLPCVCETTFNQKIPPKILTKMLELFSC